MVMMSLSIEKVLADARMLCSRLKDHDSCADNLITNATTLDKRMDAMKEYEEDLNELNEIARHRPRANLILGLAQENSQIRELQNENRELRVALEEHQSALELIMKKYREQVAKLMAANRLDKALVTRAPGDQLDGCHPNQIDKICEMAAVMRQAIQVDEESATRDKQHLVQLQHENKTLREILQITGSPRSLNGDDKETQTSDGDDCRSHTDSLSGSAEVADILRQLDLPGEDSYVDDDTETESESETNCSMVSTIKRGTNMKQKREEESSSQDEEAEKSNVEEETS
ncbi:hypothetical protein CAPTEDRAFT_204806 [Capitella teleta]|uniref:FGFR1 oncogene partner 2 homolog n=1 Tax=Capitella teleta TaxID=283909 RepID=R7U960_CAPTE|nr:hypothetical protein CAPTEDRAFT_204806 [Capitella teleta]|eukprot:ELU02494.1 hypothetical protein CAPTEDRAFT_204806 [Capitella teleta]